MKGGRGARHRVIAGLAPIVIVLAVPLVVVFSVAIGAVVKFIAERPQYEVPPPAYNAFMAWNGARHEVVMVAGRDPRATWTWDGAGWRRHADGLRPPVSGQFPSAEAYDPSRRAVVAVVGDQSGRAPADTWTWTGRTWQQSGGDATFDVLDPAMGYDQVRGELVVAGIDSHDPTVIHTWILRGTDWVPMRSSPAETKFLIHSMNLAFDRSTQRLLLFPRPLGADDPCPLQAPCAPVAEMQALAWDGTQWATTSVIARTGVVMSDPNGTGLLDITSDQRTESGVWRWDGKTWSRITGLPVPSTLSGWSAAPDPD